MSDDLVKRLRNGTYADYDQCTNAWQAADRIEQLEEEINHQCANVANQHDRIEALEADLSTIIEDSDDTYGRLLERIEQLEAALVEMLDVVATHRVYVGNSPAGELACEWTMDAIKEIHGKMEDVLARVALEGKKDDR